MLQRLSIRTTQPIKNRQDSKQDARQFRSSLDTTEMIEPRIFKASGTTDVSSGESTNKPLAQSTSRLSRMSGFASNAFKRGQGVFQPSPSERHPSEDEFSEELDLLEKQRIPSSIIPSAPAPPLSRAIKNLATTIKALNIDSAIRRKKKGKRRAQSSHFAIACKRNVDSVRMTNGNGKPSKKGRRLECLQIIVGRTFHPTSARRKRKFLAEEEAPWGAHRPTWEPPYEGPSDWWRRPPGKDIPQISCSNLAV